MSELTTTLAAAATKLLELISIRRVSESIYVAAILGIADLLDDGPKSAEQLADATCSHAPSLRRVMRVLARFDVFSEDDSGRFALAPMGEFLKSSVEGTLRPAALIYGGEKGGQIEAQLLHCVKTGETAIQKLFGRHQPRFELFLKDREQAELFNATMTAFSTLHMTGLLEVYDFSPIKKIVDVGGGHGKNIAEILMAYPNMRGVLFDMPHAYGGGMQTIMRAGLVDRCEVVSGDFFVSVPEGADAYLLSRVIHDWVDEKAITILKVVRGAIAPGGRLLLMEAILGRDQRSAYPLLSDLNMMLRPGGRERTEDEYRALYQKAGFELTRTVTTMSPTGATVIEGRPV
jgi:O-methyltransferase domain